MKFQLESKPFQKSLALIAGVPCYNDQTILLSTDKEANEIIMECAGQGSYIKLSLPAEVLEEGSVSVSASFITSLRLDKMSLFLVKKSILFVNSGNKAFTINTSQSDTVEGNRPTKEIECPVTLPTAVLINAILKNNLVPSIPNPNHGLRMVVADQKFKVTCNDMFRGTMFSSALPHAEDIQFDVMFKVPVLASLVNRVTDSNISMGTEGGVLRLQSMSVDFYYPTLQASTEDLEAFFNSLDLASCSSVDVETKQFASDVKAASSIVGNVDFNSRLDVSFRGSSANIKVSTGTGHSSLAEHTLVHPLSSDPFDVKLSNKYLQSMLGLLGDDTVTMFIWPEKIVFSTNDDSYMSVMQTVSE